jgi:hypothetical protein
MTHLQEPVEPSAEPDAYQAEPSKPLKPINLTTPAHYHPLDPLSAAEINSACRAAIG